MDYPSRVVVTGPLAAFAAGYKAELERLGYRPGSIALKLQLAGQLSRWLGEHECGVGDLTDERIAAFFAWRRTRVRVLFVSPAAVAVLMAHLRAVGAAPFPPTVEPTELDRLLERYGGYLRHERGLAEGTIRRYVSVAGGFLSGCTAGTGVADLDAVTALAAVALVRRSCDGRSTGWGRAVAVALRSLFRWLFLEGLIEQDLASAVPVPAVRPEGLPAAVTSEDLALLLASCDRETSAGRRDFAVLLLLAGLGLRAAEVAGLDLDDVDWREGLLRIHGKGSRVDVLPLPAAVGQALADYIRHARPGVGRGVLFRQVVAPHGGLAAPSVTGIVYRASDRAGVGRVGAHRLRHTAATQMLRGGASLPQIAQVLRHSSTVTTAIYATVDHDALAALARPWPAVR